MIEVIPLKAFTDNYIWALVSKKSVYVVDPGDPNPVLSFIKENDLNLKGILITHHHFDHTGGIKTLVDKLISQCLVLLEVILKASQMN